MGGRGSTPKGRRVRARDGARVIELHPRSDKRHGRPLPRGLLPEGESWHPATVSWWNAIRSWALMADEPEVSWSFLLDCALMHHTMWSRGRHDLASEIRLRVCQFGATPEARRRLGVTVRTPSDESDSPSTRMGTENEDDPTSLAARRRRLTDGDQETPPA